MTDMEMLELAAKAAGIEHLGGEYCVSGSELWDVDGKKWWRPLANDGYALRMAVACQLGISFVGGLAGLVECVSFKDCHCFVSSR